MVPYSKSFARYSIFNKTTKFYTFVVAIRDNDLTIYCISFKYKPSCYELNSYLQCGSFGALRQLYLLVSLVSYFHLMEVNLID